MQRITRADSFESLLDDAEQATQAGLSWADVESLSAQEVNENWAAVSEVLARGPGGAPLTYERPASSSAPRSTGLEIAGHSSEGARVPLSKSALAAMSHEEIVARGPEIDAWLSAGGASR